MNTNLNALSDKIRNVCSTSQVAWFDAALDKLHSSNDATNLLATLITQTRRNVGSETLTETSNPLDTAAGPLYTKHWSATDATRVALLLAVIENRPDDTITIVNDIYKLADEAEHVSIVKGLVLYSKDDSLKPLALDAARTNSRPLFSALALENPYPAAYYSEQEFNQLVLKALFTGLNIDALQNLQQRSNQELSRMAEDYLEERVAASRSIPVDIWLALAPFRSTQGEKLLLNAVSDSDDGHRYYATKAATLCGATDPEFHAAFTAQLKAETDDRIRELLKRALAN